MADDNPGLEKTLAELQVKLEDFEKEFGDYIKAEKYDAEKHKAANAKLKSLLFSTKDTMDNDPYYKDLPGTSPLVEGFEGLHSRAIYLEKTLSKFAEKTASNKTEKLAVELVIMGSQFLKSKFKNVDDYIDNLTTDFKSNGEMEYADFEKKYKDWGDQENDKPDFKSSVKFEIHKTGTILQLVPSPTPNGLPAKEAGGLELVSVTWSDVTKTPTKATVTVVIKRTSATQIQFFKDLDKTAEDATKLLKKIPDAYNYKTNADGTLVKVTNSIHSQDNITPNVALNEQNDNGQELYKELKYTPAELQQKKLEHGLGKAVVVVQLLKKIIQKAAVPEKQHTINLEINLETPDSVISCPENQLGRIEHLEYKRVAGIGRKQKYIIKAGVKDANAKILPFISK